MHGMEVKGVLAVFASSLLAVLSTLAEGTGGTWVKASSFGWNAEDATECLQRAIDSGSKKILVDRRKSDWIVRPLKLKDVSNVALVLDEGVVVRAKAGEFKAQRDCLLTIQNCCNVCIEGRRGAQLVMNKTDYLDVSKHEWSEWRHAIAIAGGCCIQIRDLEISSSGGDGVYICGAASNVRLENLICLNHDRQGISLISAVGLLVKKCVFNTTGGTPPQCGVDIEPNKPTDRLEQIVFEECVFDENKASGIDFYLASLNETSRPISITFRGCMARGNGDHGITLSAGGPKGGCNGTILFENCSVAANATHALRLMDFQPNRLSVKFKGCMFDARGSAFPAVGIGADYPYNFSGVSFENSRVILDEEQKGIKFSAMTGVGCERLSGTLDFVHGAVTSSLDLASLNQRYCPDPAALQFTTSVFDCRNYAGAGGMRLAEKADTGFLRDGFTFLQYVPSAGKYRIGFAVKRVAASREVKAFFRLRDRLGTDLGVVELPEGESEYVIDSKSEGLFRFEIACGFGLVSVSSDLPGQGVRADDFVHLFAGDGREYSFVVPAGREDVRVQVRPLEPCSAELISPSGEVVDTMVYSQLGKILVGKRVDAAAAAGVWRVRFPKVQEDALFRVGSPAIPVVFGGADAAGVMQERTR